MIKASDALKRPGLKAPVKKHTPPIRASELVQRRHKETLAALEKTITDREKALVKVHRLTGKIWKLARTLNRYDKLTTNGAKP